jgi:hypothetical protein
MDYSVLVQWLFAKNTGLYRNCGAIKVFKYYEYNKTIKTIGLSSIIIINRI